MSPGHFEPTGARLLTSLPVRASGRFSRRASLAARMDSKPALHRARGAFVPEDPDECREPRRTERLLARPFELFPRGGVAALESTSVTVLFKCRGDPGDRSCIGVG